MSLFDNEDVLTPEILKQHGFIKCGSNRWGYFEKFYNYSTLFLRIDLSQYTAFITVEGFCPKIKETIKCKTIFDFNYIFNKYSKINGKNKYIVTDSHVYFHGSFLSNWYPCPIEYEGKSFHCSEQLYMWFKAKYFRDNDTADKILKCTHAREAKDLGRQVNGFDKERWDERSFGYMLYCVYLKFKQNFDLRDELFKLGEGRKFVEGSPVDTIWGVGIDYRDMKIRDEKNWKGQNKLGQCLDYTYNELKNTKDRIELI